MQLPYRPLPTLLFSPPSVGESDKKRQRTFKIIATSCAILYAVVIAIALINWFGVPFSFWSQFGKGFALIFLTVFILACPFVAIVEHRSGKISALLCLTIVGFECVMVTGFAIGFLDIRSIQADLRHYVMPRHLDPDKIEAISDYLQKFPPHSLIICWDGYDSEASSYADQIRTAVFNGGWTVKPCPDPTSDLRKVMGSGNTTAITRRLERIDGFFSQNRRFEIGCRTFTPARCSDTE